MRVHADDQRAEVTRPESPQALAEKGIIPAVPEDPFGFTFVIKPDGVAGIKTD